MITILEPACTLLVRDRSSFVDRRPFTRLAIRWYAHDKVISRRRLHRTFCGSDDNNKLAHVVAKGRVCRIHTPSAADQRRVRSAGLCAYRGGRPLRRPDRAIRCTDGARHRHGRAHDRRKPADERHRPNTSRFVGDDGKRVPLIGKSFDAFPDGVHAEAIGWLQGSAFTVSDMRTVAMTKAQTLTQPSANLEVEGTLLLAHLDFLESGRGEYLYTVRDDAGHMTRLNLAGGDGLAPGMRVIALGSRSIDGRSMDVDDLTIISAAPKKARIEGQPVTQATTNNVLVILVKFTDSPASDPFTQAQVQDVMTNATTGVAQYYNEVSYGRQLLNITVTNWLVGRNPSSHAPMATPPSCDFDTMGTYGDTAASDAGYTGAYQNRFYVMPAELGVRIFRRRIYRRRHGVEQRRQRHQGVRARARTQFRPVSRREPHLHAARRSAGPAARASTAIRSTSWATSAPCTSTACRRPSSAGSRRRR